MKNKIKKDALLQLKLEVEFGFDNKEEIFDNISFKLLDNEDFDEFYDEEQLMELISEYYKKHQQKSLNWSFPTDFDKLANAFDELIKQKIICLHNVYNREDGKADCLYAIEVLSKKQIEAIGFCYYNSHDLELAINSKQKSLILEFESLKPNKKEEEKIKSKIINLLKNNGLQVSIPEVGSKTIEIKNINWKKKPDQEDWWIDRVVSLLTNTLPTTNFLNDHLSNQ